MPKDSSRFLSFAFIISALHLSAAHARIASNWTNPNAQLPSFTSTYLVGERIMLSWLALNQSQNDLWLTRFDVSTDDFALRIASDLDISNTGSFAWTIAVSDDEVLTDTRFEFQFVAAGSNYNATAPTELASPGFNLMLVNQVTQPNGTAASTRTDAPSISSAGPPSTSNQPSADESRLSHAVIAGIAIGVIAAVGLGGFAVGYLVFKKRQARHNQTIGGNSDVTVTGPYEVLGDDTHPMEVIKKEAAIHEMNSSQDTIVAESGGTPVHEVSNTIKRIGLHEMPG